MADNLLSGPSRDRAIQTIYDEAAYDLRIDYRQPPSPPDLTPEDAEWIEAHLQSIRGEG